MLRHPQPARLLGVAASAVAVGSRAAHHRWSVTLVTTSCLVQATSVPSRLLSPIVDHTYQKFILVPLVPIRGNLEDCFLGKADRLAR